jgi:hypothetical protein
MPALPPEPGPAQIVLDGNPWSLIFARHPTVPTKQGVWIFNHKDGEFWELVNNTSFVLRPRQDAPRPTPRRKARRS